MARLLVLVLGLGLGGLFASMGVPLAQGREAATVPGLRGRAAQLAPAALAEVHRITGWELVGTGVVVALLALLLFARHVRPTRAALGVVGTTFLLVQAVSWHGRWLAERLAGQ